MVVKGRGIFRSKCVKPYVRSQLEKITRSPDDETGDEGLSPRHSTVIGANDEVEVFTTENDAKVTNTVDHTEAESSMGDLQRGVHKIKNAGGRFTKTRKDDLIGFFN